MTQADITNVPGDAVSSRLVGSEEDQDDPQTRRREVQIVFA